MTEYVARFPSSPNSVAKARRTVKNFARLCGFNETALGEIEVAVGEAVANAIEHGHVDCGYFSLHCRLTNHSLVIDITDCGPGFATWQEVTERPEAESAVRPRGFGILIMRRTMDAVEYEDRGRRVRLVKRLPVAESESADERA